MAGYSLGATHAAFVARLDDEVGAFGFERVLLINPPVDLYRSASILDAMFEEQLPTIADFNALFNQLIMRLPLGKPVDVVLSRNGATRTLQVTPQERESVEAPIAELPLVGITASNLTTWSAKELKRDSRDGVHVRTVRPGGPAAGARLHTAVELTRLPATVAALRSGAIDLPKTRAVVEAGAVPGAATPSRHSAVRRARAAPPAPSSAAASESHAPAQASRSSTAAGSTFALKLP